MNVSRELRQAGSNTIVSLMTPTIDTTRNADGLFIWEFSASVFTIHDNGRRNIEYNVVVPHNN